MAVGKGVDRVNILPGSYFRYIVKEPMLARVTLFNGGIGINLTFSGSRELFCFHNISLIFIFASNFSLPIYLLRGATVYGSWAYELNERRFW